MDAPRLPEVTAAAEASFEVLEGEAAPRADSPPPPQAALAAKLSLAASSVRPLFLAGSALHTAGKRDVYATVRANVAGITLSAESSSKSRYVMASIKAGHFTSYDVTPVRGPGTEILFRISINSLLEALSLFGGNTLGATSLKMVFDEARGVLMLALVEGGTVAEVAILTLEAADDEEEAYAGAFGGAPSPQKPCAGQSCCTTPFAR